MSYNGQANPWQRNNLDVFQQGQQIYIPQAQQSLNHFAGHPDVQGVNVFPTSDGNAIVYPHQRTSTLNPVAFPQTSGNGSQSQQYNSIGTVTKIKSDCGLVNDEVFFNRNVCKGYVPKLGDRVLFESNFSSSGQFKWTATRIQSMQQPQSLISSKSFEYDAVAPPGDFSRSQHHVSPPRRERNIRSDERECRYRERYRRSGEKDEDIHDRKRRREDRSLERSGNSGQRFNNVRSLERGERGRGRDGVKREDDGSMERKDKERAREREKDRTERSVHRVERSPHRSIARGRRTRTIRRYLVQIPKSVLSYQYADVNELRQRYATLYVPSDFFHAKIKWSEAFTPENPFSLNRPCQFHIMHKIVDPPFETYDLQPIDANYLYSAKVMLMALPPLAQVYQKCFEEEDSDNEHHTVHPSRLISFLVGTCGRNEPMAIGGPWSPSLDGENPENDPAVLIRTAIRTCKALTGIDLSMCTQWYRFVEFYYHREEYKNKEKNGPARVEKVVMFLPDVHSCMPELLEWQNLTQSYKMAVDNDIASRTSLSKAIPLVDSKGNVAAETASLDKNAEPVEADLEGQETESSIKDSKDIDSGADTSLDNTTQESSTTEEVPQIADGDNNENEKREPTHFSQLDLNTMEIPDIRNELIARNLSAKGARNLLMARLAKAINVEKTKERKSTDPIEIDAVAPKEEEQTKHINSQEDQDDWADVIDVDMTDIVILDEYDSSKNPEDSPQELDEKEKSQLIRRYTLPSTPHIVVHPNKVAKDGKFDCSVMSLSVLLDYRLKDTKERFFEVSLFAELFNEMLQRDFGFNIYKELYIFKQSSVPVNDSKVEESSENREKSNPDTEEKGSSGTKTNDDAAQVSSHTRERRCSKRQNADEPQDDKKEKDKESIGGRKIVVSKPQLLLSFIYFDTSHCGYIFEKDLEDLFSILGLSLSRGQIRKVLEKLSTRQAVYYRKLTDKEASNDVASIVREEEIQNEQLKMIAMGNKIFSSVFQNYRSGESDDLVNVDEADELREYKGAVIHVGKLVEQIKRTEKKYFDLDKLYHDLRKQHEELQRDNSRATDKLKEVQSEIKSLSRKLLEADQNVLALNRKYKEQQSTLSYVYNRVAPYFSREKDRKARDHKDKDHKSESSREKDCDKKKHTERDLRNGKDKEEATKGLCREMKKETPSREISENKEEHNENIESEAVVPCDENIKNDVKE